MISQVR